MKRKKKVLSILDTTKTKRQYKHTFLIIGHIILRKPKNKLYYTVETGCKNNAERGGMGSYWCQLVSTSTTIASGAAMASGVHLGAIQGAVCHL